MVRQLWLSIDLHGGDGPHRWELLRFVAGEEPVGEQADQQGEEEDVQGCDERLLLYLRCRRDGLHVRHRPSTWNCHGV